MIWLDRDTSGCRTWRLGFLRPLLVVGCLPALVWATVYTILDASAEVGLGVGDTLVSTPNPYFEMGIFPYPGLDPIFKYYLSIRYTSSNDPSNTATWTANRKLPLSNAAKLTFHKNGIFQISDQNQDDEKNNLWFTSTNNIGAVSAELLDSGKLVLKNKDGGIIWNSFDNCPPTDTLLPGQAMHRSQGHSLTSWQRTGNPAMADGSKDVYSFEWDPKGVLRLSWTCPKEHLHWNGGTYIPAPDVYAAHTIKNVDKVYFHKRGHLYIGSDPPTAILSGGPDIVNATTLRRITIDPDGGLRIWQLVLNATSNQNSNTQQWKAVANWVVSDRPDSRSMCTAFGTCGANSLCVSAIDFLGPVTCRCPGQDDVATKDWFKPLANDSTNGCQLTNQTVLQCPTNKDVFVDSDMMELPNVDAPWGGDYRIITVNESAGCRRACLLDCYCAGAVYSKDEGGKCWLKNGLINLGYPTVALHGNDRTLFVRIQPVVEYPRPEKDNKWAKILVPVAGGAGALLAALGVFCLWRNDEFRRRVQACGSCLKETWTGTRAQGDKLDIYVGPRHEGE